MRFARVTLYAPARALPELAEFYGDRLGLPILERSREAVAIAVGETRLELVGGGGDPFYHVALLVPGDRFDAALGWIRQRVDLLPDAESGDAVFAFTGWGAQAVYFHDPAGSIVELIAHTGLGESGAGGAVSGAELVGLSEVGLVGDTAALAGTLGEKLGLELWDGRVGVEGWLGFVGEKARTLILSPPGRGWLPTERPAEPHPLEIVLAAPSRGEVVIGDGLYVVR